MSAGDGLAALDAITGEFELVGVGRSARPHELRIGGAAVARLDATGSSGTASHARTRDGAWDFEGEGVLRPHVVVREVGSGEEVASLRSKGITGAKGTVQLGGRELAYHTEGVLSDTWVLLEDEIPLVTVTRNSDGHYRVICDSQHVDGLLLVIACYGAVQSSGGAAAATATS